MSPDDHEPEAMDSWARTLLQRAAETVEVDPSGPLDLPSRKPVWPLLAAAAAVLATATATAVVTLGGGSAPPASTPRDDGHFRLGPDQVPSVFGYDRESAVHLLTERGLRVTVSPRPNCLEPAGRALRTRPGVGRIFAPGDPVTVVVSAGPSMMRCPFTEAGRAIAWQFMDLANGRGSDSDFARTVTVFAGDGRKREVESEHLSDLGSWEVCDRAGRQCVSPLSVLRDASGEVQVSTSNGMYFTMPLLRVDRTHGIPCTDELPRELAGRRGIGVTVEFPADGFIPHGGPCRGVVLYENDQGKIDAVAVGDTWEAGYAQEPPTVVGMSVTGARDRLEADGYTVVEVPRRDCAQPGTVTAQAPEPSLEGPPETDVITLGVVDQRGPCNDAPLLTTPAELAGQSLLAFARGGHQTPAFAAEVGVYVGNELQTTLTPEQAADPAGWDSCPTYAGRECPLSPLRQLAAPGPVVYSGPPPEGRCLVRLRDLPPELEADLGSSTRMDQPEPRGCRDFWAVQVWVDDSGAISAVNLLLGPEPTAG